MCFSDLGNHLAGFLQRLWARIKNKPSCLTVKQQIIRRDQTRHSGSPLPAACLRPPCAAGPCLLTRSAGRWEGQTYTADRPARSGGCPSRGWPESASPPWAHCSRERGGRTEWTDGRKQGGRVARYLGCPPDGAVWVGSSMCPNLSKYPWAGYLTLPWLLHGWWNSAPHQQCKKDNCSLDRLSKVCFIKSNPST